MAMSDSQPPTTSTFFFSAENRPKAPPIVYEKIEDLLPEPYYEIQYMLEKYHPHRISVSCFETTYEEMFKRSLDYNLLGVDTIEELLVKLCEMGMVLVDKYPKTDERHVKLAYKHKKRSSSSSSKIHARPTESSDLYQEIQYLLSGYGHGVSLYWLEERYHSDFRRSADYDSVGVKNLEQLIGKMKDKGRVLVFKHPESKATSHSKVTFVMSAWVVDSLRKLLKHDVLAVLHANGGKIPLRHFHRAFEDRFKLKLKYHHYGLTGLDHLCEVLNLGLEEADSSGEKVIKAHKIYNLRKRNRNG